jgi:hypothetical protein
MFTVVCCIVCSIWACMINTLECWWWRQDDVVVIVLITDTVVSVVHPMVVKRFETEIDRDTDRDKRFPTICIKV